MKSKQLLPFFSNLVADWLKSRMIYRQLLTIMLILRYTFSIESHTTISFFFFQANLLEQREKIQQKHDEAKSLKDGIDRRSRLVTNILRKYLSDEQFDDYEHFIRMKSTLLMDAKDIEEKIQYLQKQIQIILHSSSHFDNHVDRLQPNYCKSISTTA